MFELDDASKIIKNYYCLKRYKIMAWFGVFRGHSRSLEVALNMATCIWRHVSDFNPTLALAADTIFLRVSDYINCIAVLCLNEHVCMYVKFDRAHTSCY